MLTRKEISIQDYRISYLENNAAENVILIFIHGNSGAAQMWEKQLKSTLLSNYHLIALDLPGHGQSQSLDPADCNLIHLSSLVAQAILDLTKGKSFFLIGFSMGANIVSETLFHDIRPAGIILISPTLFGSSTKAQPKSGDQKLAVPLFSEDAPEEAVLYLFKKACLSNTPGDLNTLLAGYKRTQKSFRPSILLSLQQGLVRDEIQLLRQADKALLIFFGSSDCLINPDYLDQATLTYWQNSIIKIPGGGHFINMEHPQIINEWILNYIQFFKH